MRIAVTGTHGFVGHHLVAALRSSGHEVVALVRGAPKPGEVVWDPASGLLDAADLVGVRAVVHLAGAGVASRRWSEPYKRLVLESRVLGTRLVAARVSELARSGEGPEVLLSASAVGYYGSRGDEVLDETSSPGPGFLAEVCQKWEAEAAVAEKAGVRAVMLRSGVVLGTDGGALRPQLLPFRLGLGARLGDGLQWTSWISIEDEVDAIRHCISTETSSGPVNVVSPNPVTNAELTKTLAAVLGRPALLAIPSAVLEVALGREMARETLLASQRARPAVLEAGGYRFAHPSLEPALRALLERPRRCHDREVSR